MTRTALPSLRVMDLGATRRTFAENLSRMFAKPEHNALPVGSDPIENQK